MKKKTGGYFTVEAAYLMPFAIFLMALLCYLAFYMCNRCLIVQDTYILGLRGSRQTGQTNKETAAYILEQGKELTPKYHAISKLHKWVKAERTKITVELKGSMKLPFACLQWEESPKIGTEWEFQSLKEADRTDPVEFIRACRKVEKIGGEG